MKLKITLIIVGLIIISFTGCMTVNLTAEGVEKTVAMSSNVNKKYTIVKHFSKDLKGYFTIFNLVTISDPKVSELIRNELISAQGDAVINIKIQGQTTFIDGLVPIGLGVIGGIIAPPYGTFASYLIGLRTYTVEGDVIKYLD